jgi:hypothetical protein
MVRMHSVISNWQQADLLRSEGFCAGISRSLFSPFSLPPKDARGLGGTLFPGSPAGAHNARLVQGECSGGAPARQGKQAGGRVVSLARPRSSLLCLPRPSQLNPCLPRAASVTCATSACQHPSIILTLTTRPAILTLITHPANQPTNTTTTLPRDKHHQRQRNPARSALKRDAPAPAH